MTLRTDIDFLNDILTAAHKAIDFTSGMSREQFRGDDKTIFAVVRALEIIGEATKRISQTVRDRHVQIPWRLMAGMRDKLIHDYISVNVEVVWETVTVNLPPLLPLLRQVLQDVPSIDP
jgi:uncharacterized protein with HEPN domain